MKYRVMIEVDDKALAERIADGIYEILERGNYAGENDVLIVPLDEEPTQAEEPQ